MRRFSLIALSTVAVVLASMLFALPVPVVSAGDSSLPPGMPDLNTAQMTILCDLETLATGAKFYRHSYQNFPAGAEMVYPVWHVQIFGRDGENLMVVIQRRASEDEGLEKTNLIRSLHTEWQSQSPFSEEEREVLSKCTSKKYYELVEQYKAEHTQPRATDPTEKK